MGFSQNKQSEFFQTHSGIIKKKYFQLSDFGSSNIVVAFHFMPRLPYPFTCTVHGPDDDALQIECWRWNSRSDVEEKIRSQMK
jgi:hypothetical protein